MRRPCRRPRPVGPLPFGDRAPSTRDTTPRRPRPPGNPPALCQRGDAAGGGGVALVGQPPSVNKDSSGIVIQGGFSGDVLTRSEHVLHSATTGSDPLMHSGRWVPAEYRLCKEVPSTRYWTCCGNKTAFTTHCLSFEARIHQREDEHQRDSAEQLNRARQLVAGKFRAEWESKRTPASSFPNDGASCSSGEQQRDEKSQHAVMGINIGLSHQSKRKRPFLRPRWLKILRESASNTAASTAPGHQVSSPSTLSTSTETSAADPVIPKRSAASIRVRKDHIRSVIHLALSEARINAFVVISCLEGFLSVAMEGMRPALKEVYSTSFDARANNDGRGSGWKEKRCTKTSRHGTGEDLGKRGARQATSISDPTADCTTTNGACQNESFSATATVDVNNSSSSSSTTTTTTKEESGAALCVRLGALPAVLGCLNEHAGHKQIEPLAIKLLSLFASDSATSSAVRGNATVATACASRIFPAAFVPVAGDASGTGLCGDASEQSSLSFKNTCGGHERQPSAGSGRCRGRADGGQSLEHLLPTEEVSKKQLGHHGRIVETTGDGSTAAANDGRASASFVASSASIPRSFSASGAASNLKPIVGAAQPFSTTLNSPTSSSRPAASAEGISHIPREQTPSNAPSAPAATMKRRPTQLPPTDLVFVLSVVVQDSPACQRLVIQSGGIAAMSAALQQQASGVEYETSNCGGVARACNEGNDGAPLAEMCLRVMESLGQPERGRRRIVREGSVETAIAIIGRFRSDDGVLAAATGLLLLLSDSPKGRGRILKAGGFLVVFEAVQRLVGNGQVQVKGVEMLQTLINKEPQARCELDSIKGGWQWLCQGTSGGNALVRYSPGERHIPGWTMSEQEKLTIQEALATAEMAASDWTPHNLATFMGTMRSQHKLQIGNLAYYHFFRVVSEAGLLPHAHEDIEEWRDRMRRYEDERHIRVGNITRRRLGRDRSGAHARSLGSSSASLTL